MQKPTDPPSGAARGKSGDSLSAPSGQSSQDKSGSSSGSQMGRGQGRRGEMGSQAGARGMSGQRSKEEIKQIQEALKDKGHDPGMADGVMGPKTQQAIRAFQKENGIQATGRLDEKTASALGVDKSGASSSSDKSSSPSGASSTERKGSSPSGAGSSSGGGSSMGGSSSGSSPSKAK